MAFDDSLDITEKGQALIKYVGKAPAHELITAIYGIDPTLTLGELDRIDVAPLLQFQALHGAIVRGERFIQMVSSGEVLDIETLRRRATKKGEINASRVLGFCRARAQYQVMALQAQENQKERERTWAERLVEGVSRGTLVVMTLGANHAMAVRSNLISGVQSVGIFTASGLYEALQTSGIDPQQAMGGQAETVRVQRVLSTQLADLELTNSQTRAKEGCDELLKNIAR